MGGNLHLYSRDPWACPFESVSEPFLQAPAPEGACLPTPASDSSRESARHSKFMAARLGNRRLQWKGSVDLHIELKLRANYANKL